MSLAEVGMVLGTVPFLWMTTMPGAEYGTVPGRVSLVPLRDLLTMGPVGIVGNLLIFAALGFLAPMRFAAAGVRAADPDARGGLFGPGRNRTVRPAAGPGVLRGRRTGQRPCGAVLAALASRRWWCTTAEAPSDQRRPALAPAG